MKHFSATGGTAVGMLMLVAAIMALTLRTDAWGNEGPAEATVSVALRRVQVHRVGCNPGTSSDAEKSMSIVAQVEAVGLKWRSLVAEIRLRRKDGGPVLVADSAPEGYSNENGQFFMSARAPIWSQRIGWPSLGGSFPYETVLGMPSDEQLRCVASFRASCDGLTSVSESEITIPPKPGAERAVRLLAIDVFGDSMPPAGMSQTETVAGGGPRRTRKPEGPGLTVEAYVEACQLNGLSITGRMSLRSETGQPITTVDQHTGKKLPLESRASVEVVPGQAQILLHFVPYNELDLEPGNHRLIIRYAAHCDGLAATMEELHAIPIPAGGEAP
jgi:hypothetical protein